MSSVVLLIRHGEKPVTGINGVTINGVPSEHSLIPRGWERAGALARFLAPGIGRSSASGFPVPQLLMAASPSAPGADSHEQSRREEETITPLAELLGIAPNLNFGKGEESEIAAAALRSSVPVLIVWEHENIPKLGQAIAPDAAVPAHWPSDRFDLVWVFRSNDRGIYEFEQVPQLLLAGDSAEPIT